jgi:Dephospho-CoA kinase
MISVDQSPSVQPRMRLRSVPFVEKGLSEDPQVLQLKRPFQMKVVGLTGGIACGKSTVSNMFRRDNIDIVDFDQIAHRVVRKVRAASGSSTVAVMHPS